MKATSLKCLLIIYLELCTNSLRFEKSFQRGVPNFDDCSPSITEKTEICQIYVTIYLFLFIIYWGTNVFLIEYANGIYKMINCLSNYYNTIYSISLYSLCSTVY